MGISASCLDRRCWDRAPQGNPQEFAVLYRQYVDPVFRYCAHPLDGREAAEDVTSDIFVKAMIGLHNCRDERAFRRWLFAIVHHVVPDRYRARRPVSSIDAAEADGQVLVSAPSPQNLALVSDRERSVHTQLSQLTARQARILELRLAEG